MIDACDRRTPACERRPPVTVHRFVHARLALTLATLLAQAGGARIAHAGAAADSLPVPSARVRAWQLGIARPDRLEHASLSFTFAAGTGLAGGTRAQAFVLSLGLGVLKELRDGRQGRFDPLDLAADAFGAGLGARAAGRR